MLRKISDRSSGFVYLRRKMDPTAGERVTKLKIAGIGTTSEPKRRLPAGLPGVAGARAWSGPTTPASPASSTRRRHAARQRRRAPDREGRARQAGQHRGDEARPSAGKDLQLTLDARIQERAEAVLARGGPDLPPEGRDRGGDGPAHRRDPRAGQLAAGERQQRSTASPAYARQDRAVQANYEPGSTFKAITVAGRAGGGLVTPDTTLRRAADDPGGRPHDRARRTRPRRRDAHERGADPRQSSNIGAVKIGLQLGRAALRQVGAAVRLRQADGRGPAGRGGRHRPAPRAVLGLLDGQHADRPGHRGHADADGDGLHARSRTAA